MAHSLSAWLERLERLHPTTIELGLERVGSVWSALGAPRPAARIHTVAGTNGKGSTVAMIEAVFAANDRRVGAYTSPHLLRFTERLRIAGAERAESAWVAAFERVEAARGDTSLTYFEFTTLAAFHLMAEARLDVAVLEVGLGGRLDAVNIVETDCAVITAIDLDHRDWLGPDRETIGREKAGIARAGRPLVIGDRQPPASVIEHGRALGSSMLCLGPDFDWHEHGDGILLRVRERELGLPAPALDGVHQRDNLATALAAIGATDPEALDDPASVGRGVLAARPPGRLQHVPGSPPLWIDVGHNPHAAAAVTAVFAGRGQRVHAVVAMLADKDHQGFAAALAPVVAQWHLATPAGRRAFPADALASEVRAAAPGASIYVHDSVADALVVARRAGGEVAGVLVTGSFLAAAAALSPAGC